MAQLCLYKLQTLFMHLDFRKWFFQYKLLHIIMCVVVWSSTFITYYEKKEPLVPQAANALMVVMVWSIPFYINAYVLIPRTLYRRKYTAFISLLIFLFTSSGIIMLVAVRFIDHIFCHARVFLHSFA